MRIRVPAPGKPSLCLVCVELTIGSTACLVWRLRRSFPTFSIELVNARPRQVHPTRFQDCLCTLSAPRHPTSQILTPLIQQCTLVATLVNLSWVHGFPIQGQQTPIKTSQHCLVYVHDALSTARVVTRHQRIHNYGAHDGPQWVATLWCDADTVPCM